MDYYFQDNLNSKQQIVFFAYIPSDYLQFDDLSKDEITGVLEISEKFHKHVMEFAKNYPSYNVLIKAKNPDQRYVKYVHDIFTEQFKIVDDDDKIRSLYKKIITTVEPWNGKHYDKVLNDSVLMDMLFDAINKIVH